MQHPFLGDWLAPAPGMDPARGPAPSVDARARVRGVMLLREVGERRMFGYLFWAVGWFITIPFILAFAASVGSSTPFMGTDLVYLALVPLLGGEILCAIAYAEWTESMGWLTTQSGLSWSTYDRQRLARNFVWLSWVIAGMAVVTWYLNLTSNCGLCSDNSTYIEGLWIVVALLLVFVMLRMLHHLTQMASLRQGAHELSPNLVPHLMHESVFQLGATLVPVNPGIVYVLISLVISAIGPVQSSTVGLEALVGWAAVGVLGVLGSFILAMYYWELTRHSTYWLRDAQNAPPSAGAPPPPPPTAAPVSGPVPPNLP